MGNAINLDNDPFLTTAKINNITANRVLTAEFKSSQCSVSQT
jgi:hypothetical protein